MAGQERRQVSLKEDLKEDLKKRTDGRITEGGRVWEGEGRVEGRVEWIAD
jgi:hypothetical protein